jgi:hypothetical protein
MLRNATLLDTMRARRYTFFIAAALCVALAYWGRGRLGSR